MELKDTKIVFHELCIKMMICYSLKFSVSLFNIHTRVLQTQFHAQEKCRNREHCQEILIFASRFDKSRTNFWRFHACSSSNPKILAFYSFFECTALLFNSILDTFSGSVQLNKQRLREKNMITKIVFMSR